MKFFPLFLIILIIYLTGCGATYETRYEPILSNPDVTSGQALSMCRPQARAEGKYARRLEESKATGGGGFWGGAAEAMSANLAETSAYNDSLSSCLAGYGYQIKRVCVEGC